MKDNYVLLGGWLRNTKTYQKLIDTAPEENTVYIIPHTFIFKDTRIPTFDKINEIILQKIKEQNLNHITLIGQSLGGVFATSFAAHYPEHVKKLILVDSEGIPDKRNLFVIIFKWIKDSILFHGIAKAKENIKAALRLIKNFRYYFYISRFATSVDVREYAKKIKTPTLILWGEKDEVVPIDAAKKFKRLIKDSKLVVLSEMDHDWLIHNPQDLWNNI